MVEREPTIRELAGQLADIKSAVAGLGTKMDALPFVRAELYEAKHSALRNEFALEVARLSADIAAEHAMREAGDKQNANETASAKTAAMWALGIMCTLVIGALLAFATRIGAA